MLQNTKSPSGIEIAPLNNNFAVVISAVNVLTSPGYLIKLPPTARWVQYRSYFWGIYKQHSVDTSYIFIYFQVYCCGA